MYLMLASIISITLMDGWIGSDIVLMLKVGDDLRQDALIIQLLR